MEQRLLLEGTTDMYAISDLFIKRDEPTIRGYETKTKYRRFIELAAKAELPKVLSTLLRLNDGKLNLGIVVDADESAVNKWQSIKGQLEKFGFTTLPSDFPNNGLVLDQQDFPKVGVWIMPDNISEGYLEHFLYELIPDGDNLMPQLHQFIEELIANDQQQFPLIRRKKAEIYSWLALQAMPGSKFGTAIKAGYFNANSPLADQFVQWMKQVFDFNE